MFLSLKWLAWCMFSWGYSLNFHISINFEIILGDEDLAYVKHEFITFNCPNNPTGFCIFLEIQKGICGAWYAFKVVITLRK